jgi:two-component system sensor histidine kinase BaeS
MFNRISVKLFLALLGTAALVVLTMVLLLQHGIGPGFRGYLREKQQERLADIAQAVAGSYGQTQGWGFLETHPGQWRRLLHFRQSTPQEPDRPGPPPLAGAPPFSRPPERGFRPPPLRRRSLSPWRGAGAPAPARDGAPSLLVRGVTLFDARRRRIIGPERWGADLLRAPVRVSGQTVGWVASPALPAPSSRAELAFPHGQHEAYLMAALMALLSAGLAAALLTRRLLRPVQAIAHGAHHLARGRFDTRVRVLSRDEIGALAEDFNHLAATLEANEGARRRWIADVSHELRTPLAVLRGEIEALQDGIRPLGAQSLQSLHAEAPHLGKLVDDLYQLSLSDLGALDYRKEPLDPLERREEVIEGFRNRFRAAGLGLDFAPPTPAGALSADPRRLSQLFHNLLENSLRYTDRGGRLRVGVRRRRDTLWIDFQDSAPGVPDQALPWLFERLFRGEDSRSRRHGGAGLGLAICSNIVQAHSGSIQARHSPLGGLWVEVRLPLEQALIEHD